MRADRDTAMMDGLIAIIDVLVRTLDATVKSTRTILTAIEDPPLRKEALDYLKDIDRLTEQAHELADPVKELWRKSS